MGTPVGTPHLLGTALRIGLRRKGAPVRRAFPALVCARPEQRAVLDKATGVEGTRLLTPAENQAGYKIASGFATRYFVKSRPSTTTGGGKPRIFLFLFLLVFYFF